MNQQIRAILIGAFGVVVVVACNGGSSSIETSQNSQPGSGEVSCVPGQSVGCAGPANCPGYQTCADDGLHYLACDCTVPPPPGSDGGPSYQERCHAPDGAPEIFASRADVQAKLEGQWWVCGGAAEFWFPVEFTADNHWYKLSQVDGAFVRNLGPESSGTYRITEAGGGATFAMVFDYTKSPDAGAGYSLQGTMQVTPPGKMRLGGGDYLRLP